MNKLSYLAVMTLSVFTTLLPLYSETQAIVHESWSNRYFSPIHGDDIVCGVATDSTGAIYVAGQFCRPITGQDYALMKIAPDGEQQWMTYYDAGVQGNDVTSDFIKDPEGNFFLTGISYDYDQSSFATVKFNSQGVFQWVALYQLGGSYGENHAAAMTLDDAGNVYITGTYYEPATHSDIITLKYNSSGVQQWVTRYNDTGNYDDTAVNLAVDDYGNVYVTGYYLPSGWPNYDYITIKYNSQGRQEWVNPYNGTGNAQDQPTALRLDDQANIYVTGTSVGTSATGTDIATIKYNSAGVLQWVERYDSPGVADDFSADLEIDAQGNIIIAGWTGGSIYNIACITLKYNPAGSEQWSRIYYQGGPYCALNGAQALKIDINGNIYLTGSVTTSPYSAVSECLTLKYGSFGNLKWVARHVNEALVGSWGGTWGRYLTFDPSNNLIVAGTFCFGGDIQDFDFWVAKYQQTTSDLSVTMIPAVTPIQIPAQGGSFSYEEQTINPVVDNLRVDSWWKVIYPNQTTTRVLGPVEDRLQLGNQSTERSQRVPGNAPAGVYQYVMNVGEYPGIIWAADTLSFTKLGNGVGAGVDDWGISKENGGTRSVVSSSPGQFGLLGASPNPFNPTTIIRLTLPEAARVSLKVFDIKGCCVSGSGTTPTTGFFPAGEHQVTFDGSGLAAGVYVYRLTTGDATLSGKMVLMK